MNQLQGSKPVPQKCLCSQALLKGFPAMDFFFFELLLRQAFPQLLFNLMFHSKNFNSKNSRALALALSVEGETYLLLEKKV